MLEFSDAVTEYAIFGGVLPRNYAGGGLTVTLAWMAEDTTGDVVWTAEIERHDDEGTDLDANSFAAAQTATGAAPSTQGMVQYTAITFTNGAQMDSLAAGESFRIRIGRTGGSGSDTLAADAQLLRVEIRES